MEQALYDHPDAYDALYGAKDYEREVSFAIGRFDAYGTGGTDRRALVVGCGTGKHSALLAAEGFAVVGVDPAPAMLDRARERSDATFLRGALPDLDSALADVENATFDLVWVPYTVFNYLDSEELAPALESLDAALAEGGVLVFDLGDFEAAHAPALQIVSGDEGDCARLYQYQRTSTDRVRMNALVFVGDEWFVDTHTLTAFRDRAVADSLRERGYTVEIHDWYADAPTAMTDPTVIVAY